MAVTCTGRHGTRSNGTLIFTAQRLIYIFTPIYFNGHRHHFKRFSSKRSFSGRSSGINCLMSYNVSVTKCLIVIGSPRAKFLHDWSAITWVVIG